MSRFDFFYIIPPWPSSSLGEYRTSESDLINFRLYCQLFYQELMTLGASEADINRLASLVRSRQVFYDTAKTVMPHLQHTAQGKTYRTEHTTIQMDRFLARAWIDNKMSHFGAMTAIEIWNELEGEGRGWGPSADASARDSQVQGLREGDEHHRKRPSSDETNEVRRNKKRRSE